MKKFTADYADDLTVTQKIKVKKFLGKDNNAEVFMLCDDDEMSELIEEILHG